MGSEKHILSTNKSARVFTQGSKDAPTFILALHGYGESAESFIENFKDLSPGEFYIVCPEGLSRFYWKDFSGKVVASWMTSADRDLEIDDYLEYLDKVFQKFYAPTEKTIALGFSQGCATLARWLEHSQNSFTEVHFCGGSLSPDVDYKKLAGQNGEMNFHIGSHDKFWPPEALSKLKEKLQQAGFENQPNMFEGKHQVNPELLKNF